MRIKPVFIPLAVSAALTLALLWLLGGSGIEEAVATTSVWPIAWEQLISPLLKEERCTSVYTITNQGSGMVQTIHEFYDENDHPVHDFSDVIALGGSRAYDLLEIDELPQGYTGYVTVTSDHPVTYTLHACPGLTETCWARVNEDPVTYPTVQAAVDVATPGDVVKVAGYCAGVQQRAGLTQTVYISQSVTLRGGYTPINWTDADPDANPTTLDAQGQGRVLFITGDISPTVEGLRITGGDASWWPEQVHGGGICVVSATVTLSTCAIYSNTAASGGGVHLSNSDNATLTGNVVFGNATNAPGGSGGGIVLSSSNHAAIVGNTIYGSRAYAGGGIHLTASDNVTISGNVIHDNWGTYSGGGVNCWGTCHKLTVNHNTIYNNACANLGGGIHWGGGYGAALNGNTIHENASWAGGGVYLQGNGAGLRGNTIYSNTAQEYGGGLYLSGAGAELRDNLIRSNRVTEIYDNSDGGGIYLAFADDASLVNNVIVDNEADDEGSGLLLLSSSAHLWHTTIARNTRGDGTGICIASGGRRGSPYSSTVWLTNTLLVSQDVGVHAAGDNSVAVNGVLWHHTPVTISSSPTAVVAVENQFSGDPALAPDGYHLTRGSAAIDRGVVTDINTDINTDIDGDPRSIGSQPDLGADEAWRHMFLPLTIRAYVPPEHQTGRARSRCAGHLRCS